MASDQSREPSKQGQLPDEQSESASGQISRTRFCTFAPIQVYAVLSIFIVVITFILPLSPAVFYPPAGWILLAGLSFVYFCASVALFTTPRYYAALTICPSPRVHRFLRRLAFATHVSLVLVSLAIIVAVAYVPAARQVEKGEQASTWFIQ